MESDVEKAYLQVIHVVSDHFGPEAVVKGGMSLRLYGISRATQDIDFAFQPHRRKREFMSELEKVLNGIFDEPAHVIADSKKVQIQGVIGGVNVIVEASPHSGFEPDAITTVSMAHLFNITPQIISVMPKSLAFAHKLGAWLDRRLPRDLYDCFVYANYLKARPDLDVLEKRVTKPSYAKGVTRCPKLSSVMEFETFFRNEIDRLNPEALERQLLGIVEDSERIGLGTQIRVALLKFQFGG